MVYKSPVFYDIQAPVGWGQPNDRGDVMIVQFFLKELLNHSDFKASRPPGRDMTIDGVFGRQTEEWLLAWQNLVKNGYHMAIVVDGKVSPTPPDYMRRTHGGEFYTIRYLNASFRKRWPNDHDYLDKCPRVPGELRMKLRDVFGEAY